MDMVRERTDAEWVAELQGGNPQAVGALYDRHAEWLLSLATKWLGSRIDAEDVVHEVFMELWQRSGSFDPRRGTPRAWMSVCPPPRCDDQEPHPSREDEGIRVEYAGPRTSGI